MTRRGNNAGRADADGSRDFHGVAIGRLIDEKNVREIASRGTAGETMLLACRQRRRFRDRGMRDASHARSVPFRERDGEVKALIKKQFRNARLPRVIFPLRDIIAARPRLPTITAESYRTVITSSTRRPAVT